MSKGLLGVLSDELTKLFQPLFLVVDNPLLLDPLLLEIGASSETAGGDALLTAITKLVEVGQQLDQLSSQPSPSFSGIAALLEASDGAFKALRALGDAGGPRPRSRISAAIWRGFFCPHTCRDGIRWRER